MASELTPEAIAELRRRVGDTRVRSGQWDGGYWQPDENATVRVRVGNLSALLDAAERCAAAEAQAKAAGELLRAGLSVVEQLTERHDYDDMRAAIEAAERAGVKP